MKTVLADELLQEWYEWSRRWKPHLGMPRISPYCRESRSNAQWDRELEVYDEVTSRVLMEAVEFCIDSLPIPYSQAIGLEMRNRASRARVWRGRGTNCTVSYEKALDAVIPKMVEKMLI